MQLFEAMPAAGYERTTITYNVAMGACLRGGDWARALTLFDAMEAEGMGFHSSTFLLNLSRHRHTDATQRIPQKVLTLS
jgi:pentatricopeptide repeat protein